MSGDWQVEMLWRCGACAHRNLGRHVACQRCGKPKTGSEEYEMPSDTSEASAVQDAALLRVATGGANWRCRYCGSDQRRHDGACAQCGAAHAEGRDLGAPPPAAAAFPAPGYPAPGRGRSAIWIVVVLGFVGVFFVCGLFTFVRGSSSPGIVSQTVAVAVPVYHDVDAIVARVAWEHVVAVERRRLVDREGFADQRPADAESVRAAGKRVHHTEKVPDGFQTETYTETVPDGFRTESYTVQESCGQTCTSRAPVCSRQCTPNKNGFATCKNVCSGGGQDCQTKYCSVTKTRQVPQTKTVTRTRQVQRYRDEPRYAEWFTWKAWAWTPERTLEEHGETLETRWPAPEAVKLGKGVGHGEQERESRSAKYGVDFTGEDAQGWHLAPGTLEALSRFGIGSRHRLRVGPGDAVTCLDGAGDGG